MKRFLAIDIGCIECGEESEILGLFETEAEATYVADVARERQKANWQGQHSFRVFDLETFI